MVRVTISQPWEISSPKSAQFFQRKSMLFHNRDPMRLWIGTFIDNFYFQAVNWENVIKMKKPSYDENEKTTAQNPFGLCKLSSERRPDQYPTCVQISRISMQYWRRNLWDLQTVGQTRAKKLPSRRSHVNKHFWLSIRASLKILITKYLTTASCWRSAIPNFSDLIDRVVGFISSGGI